MEDYTNGRRPLIIAGQKYVDERGTLKYNNDFDMSRVRRMYVIEDQPLSVTRGWQGHNIESRWFICSKGSFCIHVAELKRFSEPLSHFATESFILTPDMNILFVPSGYATSIRSLEEDAQLIGMSDYRLGDVTDDYRFDLNTWKI